MKDVKQVIVWRKDLKVRKGKFGAQCGHAAVRWLLENNLSEKPEELRVELSPEEASWLFEGSSMKIVLGVDTEGELQDLILRAQLADVSVYPIVDSGKTEFNGVPTLTCAAFGPAYVDEVDRITGHLTPL